MFRVQPRGPRAGSPRGVVDSGCIFATTVQSFQMLLPQGRKLKLVLYTPVIADVDTTSLLDSKPNILTYLFEYKRQRSHAA